MGKIVMFLIFPKSFIHVGDVSEKEIAAVPPSLKRWAIWPYYFFLQIFVWVGLRYVLYEL